ncbi:MAG: response regulator [Deltaproteobacteria bacterium]|nr:response regulator [Deltaproteobacteria bacterium]
MSMNFTNRSLCKTILIVVLLLVLGVALLYGSTLYLTLQRSQLNEFKSSTMAEALKLEIFINQRLASLKTRLENMEKDNTCRVSLMLGLKPQLNNIAMNYTSATSGIFIAIVDTDKNLYPESMLEYTKSWFIRLFEEYHGELNEKIIRKKGGWFFGFVKPIMHHDQLVGYALGIYDPISDSALLQLLSSSFLNRLGIKEGKTIVDLVNGLPVTESVSFEDLGYESNADFFYVPLHSLKKIYLIGTSKPLAQERKHLLKTVFSLLFATFAFASLVMCLLLKYFSLQLYNFIRHAEKVALNPLSGELDPACFDYKEFHTLAQAFNSVLTAFREAHEKLQQQLQTRLDYVTQHSEAMERLLRKAINSSKDAIAVTDASWKVHYANLAFFKLSGLESPAVLGKNLFEYPPLKDVAPAEKSEIRGRLEGGEDWTNTLPLKLSDGRVAYIHLSISPLRHKDGTVTNYLYIARDITEYVKQEREIRESQKAQALGVMAAGIAHDFNNILTIISGAVEVTLTRLKELPNSQELIEHCNTIVEAVHRARDVVHQILVFARRTEKSFRTIDLNPLVKETIRLIEAASPSNIKMRTNIRPEPSFINADPARIHQLIMNLATNAIHAMKHGGTVTITVDRVDLDKPKAKQLGLKPGTYITISVEDTGCGIPDDYIDRIFEPFFTTKLPGEGTGLGLSVVQGIVKDLNGAIEVESELNKGSKFTVYLPTSEYISSDQPPASKHRPFCDGKSRTILLVDDEEYIAQLFSQLLESKNYKVLSFTDPLVALQHIKESGNHHFDLVITDYSMKNLNGIEFVQKLRELGHSSPVLMISGYHVSEKEALEELDIRATLTKPFTLDEVMTTIESITQNRTVTAERSISRV